MSMCPCGLRESAACCARYHAGEPAPTPEALMRSRYTAYVRGNVDYLAATQRDAVDRAAVAAWSKQTLWMGLEIVAAKQATVEFIARGVTNGKPFAQHEVSRFEQVDGRWIYVDGRVR